MAAPKQKWKGVISAAERGTLVSHRRCVSAAESLAWELTGPSARGRLDLRVSSSVLVSDPAVIVTVPLQRPWSVNLVYRVNGAPMIRVDVNDKHNGWGIGTHRHDLDSTSGIEIASPLPDFPGPTIHRPVELADLQNSFEAFLALCEIDHDPDCWTDIPGWR